MFAGMWGHPEDRQHLNPYREGLLCSKYDDRVVKPSWERVAPLERAMWKKAQDLELLLNIIAS